MEKFPCGHTNEEHLAYKVGWAIGSNQETKSSMPYINYEWEQKLLLKRINDDYVILNAECPQSAVKEW